MKGNAKLEITQREFYQQENESTMDKVKTMTLERKEIESQFNINSQTSNKSPFMHEKSKTASAPEKERMPTEKEKLENLIGKIRENKSKKLTPRH